MELEGLTEEELGARAEVLGGILRSGDVVLLDGPMGAGKTTFTRALARGLGVGRPDRVRSPTFNICLVHDGPVPLWHVDLFRVAQGEDDGAGSGVAARAAFEALGLEALADRLSCSVEAPGVLVVEWAELWAELPAGYLHVQLSISVDPDRRGLRARAVGAEHGTRLAAWTARAEALDVGAPREPARGPVG